MKKLGELWDAHPNFSCGGLKHRRRVFRELAGRIGGIPGRGGRSRLELRRFGSQGGFRVVVVLGLGRLVVRECILLVARRDPEMERGH